MKFSSLKWVITNLKRGDKTLHHIKKNGALSIKILTLARQLLLQQLVDHLGVRLSPRRLHDLPDEEAEQFFVTRLIALDLSGTLCEDLINDPFYLSLITYLDKPLFPDNDFRFEGFDGRFKNRRRDNNALAPG